MKAFREIAFVFLIAVGGIFTLSLNTLAAAKPYEYTFTKDANNTFNQIKSINQLEITFDKNISVMKDRDGNGAKNDLDLFTDGATDNPVYILQKGGTKRINIIKGVTTTPGGNVLTVTFKNLDFIDYTDTKKFEYELVIDKETLQFDQLVEYRIPFHIYDILPGFKSTFIDTKDTETINKNIFKNNATYDVSVYVPKIYITGIETIHRYEEDLLPNPLPKPTPSDDDIIKGPGPIGNDDQATPALTNIDVFADEEATRLKVEFSNKVGKEQFSRDLLRRTEDVEGFSLGLAGIGKDDFETIEDKETKETADVFNLKAYNGNGRLLEQRNFKLKVTDKKNDFIINDYLPKPTDEFGQRLSLYELMSDPKHLENILRHIPVSQLDSLGIIYDLGNTATVSDLEQLQMALDNPNIETIKISEDIDLGVNPLVIGRDVTIEGSSKVSPLTKITGSVELAGTNITVHLNDVNITDKLTINVGAKGTVVLDNVEVNGGTATTEIISGGTNSVHLNNFKTDNLLINNTSDLRVVVNGDIKKSDGSSTPVTIEGTSPVLLEGTFTTVYVKSTTTLNMTNNTKIDSIDVDMGQTLTIAGSGKGPTDITGKGNVTYPSKDGIVNKVEWTYDFDPITSGINPISTINKSSWMSTGHTFIFNTDKDGEKILENTKWDVVNKNLFGDKANITWTEDTTTGGTLKIDIKSNELPLKGDIVLQGVHYSINETEKTKTVYTVTVTVEVSE